MLIEGIENKYYSVTEEGRIFNSEGLEMKQHLTHDGYARVPLQRGLPRKKMYRVHRLVAENFIPNPEDKPVVNHLNGVRNDNRKSNLEWATVSENNRHMYLTNRGTKAKEVFQYDLNGNFIKRFDSPIDAEKETGIARQNISKVGRGLRNHAGGFFWTYASSETIEKLGEV